MRKGGGVTEGREAEALSCSDWVVPASYYALCEGAW